MCTVTFMPRKRGYALAMNRDEKRTRAKGLPPNQRCIDGVQVIYPSEPSGGTWIALNDAGVTLALIDWYSVAARSSDITVSRGEIIPSLSNAPDSKSIDARLAGRLLNRINPFRLIGFFAAQRKIIEWQWDLRRLARKAHHWQSQQWISSGFDEPKAKRLRSSTFRHFQTQASAGTTNWLRRLHRSHSPERGPYSTCMHREDAATVSYTEITVSRTQASLRHHRGSPCKRSEISFHSLRLSPYGHCLVKNDPGSVGNSRRQTRPNILMHD
jgi:hypothetical protein